MIKKINLIFVTFLGIGYIKIASGTFASLVTSIIFFYLFRFYLSIEDFSILCITLLLAEVIRFERMVEVSPYDELATRWFKPGSPTLPSYNQTFTKLYKIFNKAILQFLHYC